MRPISSSPIPAEAGRASAPRARSAAAVPWRAAAKLMLSAVVVAGLAWLGAAHASSQPLASANDPPVAASSAPSPAQSAPGASQSHPTDAGAVAPSSAVLADGRIVLNLASEDDLRKLPGIGPSRAAAIVALRTKLGRFRTARDLLRVRGIGAKTLRRMEGKLVVDAPGDAG